jgi:hypothetical protein
MNCDHFGIVARSMTGQHPPDEQTYDALEILTERLRRVRSLGEAFASVEFSGHVERLRQRCSILPVR